MVPQWLVFWASSPPDWATFAYALFMKQKMKLLKICHDYLRTLYFPLLLLHAWQENQARARAQAKQQGRKIPSLLFLEIEALSLVKSTCFSRRHARYCDVRYVISRIILDYSLLLKVFFIACCCFLNNVISMHNRHVCHKYDCLENAAMYIKWKMRARSNQSD